jgi:tRNA 2-thiocytidine biosynthesis protein TtcA
MSQYLLKSINRDIGKSIHKYNMISQGDKILVGVSGGKDSLTLLWSLHERLTRIPIKYRLYPVYIDPGFPDGFSNDLSKWLKKNGFNLRVEYTDYGIQAHASTNRENPCFLCAHLRRKRIFEITEELGCNKIAFGHHKDDIIETFFLNICYSGNISTMKPVQPVFKGKFSIIRPLSFVDEERIIRFVEINHFPEFANPCPSAKISKRKEIKEMLQNLYSSNKKIKSNIFRSLGNVKKEYLL